MGRKRTPTSSEFSVSSQDDSAWAADEHQRFLLALEQFGGGQCSSVTEAWQAIATAVGTRDMAQVVHHARLYFAQLQQLNVQRRQQRQFMQSVDQRWTPDEDAAFENMLAAFSSSSVCYPWEAMASRLPGKSPVDLKERYQKLCYDVARIESGQHVTMHFGQFPHHSGLPLSTKAAAIGESGRLASQMTSPRVLDSVVTLTPAEEQILVTAMAEVFVPPEAPADLLAGIASAVAAFTSSNGRLPPQRTHPLFTKEQALEVLNGLLAAQQSDPQVVLETLAVQLRLHPRALNVSAGVSFSGATTGANESAGPNLHLLATTGLTLGSMLPSPLGSEFGMSFESTGTTPRFLSGFGLLSPSPRPPHSKTASNGTTAPLPPLTPSGLRKSNNG
ncbi:putative tripeptidyl-peptidase [Phytophthora cinnamomi]|uniref:putative tripeptidyl-peptidase n=1 Tax=Phytophthora cinnamomi TaxID=4785 RepID=UPI0035598E86|nr:putative tripeptidyl-peptidase [Phytophthora cinnamomi]